MNLVGSTVEAFTKDMYSLLGCVASPAMQRLNGLNPPVARTSSSAPWIVLPWPTGMREDSLRDILKES